MPASPGRSMRAEACGNSRTTSSPTPWRAFSAAGAVDLRRYALAYAAPALLATTLAVGVGAAVWEQSSTARIRAELADLGVTTSVTPDGIHAIMTEEIDDKKLLVIGSMLARLSNLSSLDFAQPTKVENLEPLKGLIALRTLDLSGTPVSNLEPLKGLTALQELDLHATPVVNFDPLKGLTALQRLNLYGTQVANLEPLKGLTALQRLYLSSTKVANLEPAEGAGTALQTLDLSGTPVANLEPLKGLTALQTLDLNGTQVANLEPLKGLKLQRLDLNATQVADLEPLKGLTALQDA